MSVLIINIIIVFLLGGFIYSSQKSTKQSMAQWFLWTSFIPLWYVHSMVNIKTVPDLVAYQYYFVQSKMAGSYKSLITMNLEDIEYGYLFFCRTIGFITENFQVFLSIYSFILLFFYYKLFYKESPFVFCSVVLLLVGPYLQSLFVIRQHLATAMLIASFPLIRDRKLLKFLLVVLLSASFHRTAIIFTVVYFLYGVHGKYTKTVLVGIAAASIFFFITTAGYVGDKLGVYQSYLDSDDVQNSTGVMISSAILIASLYLMKGDVWKEGINRFSFILIYLYFLISFGGTGFNPTGRLAIYFSAGTVLLVPLSMKYIKSLTIRTVYFGVIFMMFFIMDFFRSFSEHIKGFELVPLF